MYQGSLCRPSSPHSKVLLKWISTPMDDSSISISNKAPMACCLVDALAKPRPSAMKNKKNVSVLLLNGSQASRVPVIAGTGSNNTQEALVLTQYAKEINADGALLITPYYNKPTPAGQIAHYNTIAAAVDIPIMLYNVPGTHRHKNDARNYRGTEQNRQHRFD